MHPDVTMDSRTHLYRCSHQRQNFFNTVHQLREQEIFCDVTLACDGFMFPAHRLVLAMASDFFSDILTKVSCQQPMVLVVPTVTAGDLEALLTYIYQGEIQISAVHVQSFMKAAITLKIKGLCDAVSEIQRDQLRSTDGGETSAERTVARVDGEESNSSSTLTTAPPFSPSDKMDQQSQHLPPPKNNGRVLPQVEVIIHEDEAARDMICEGVKVNQDNDLDLVGDMWQEEMEEPDPLSMVMQAKDVNYVSHLTPQETGTDSPNTSLPFLPLLPLEVTLTEDSDQYKNSCSSKASHFRYTEEQKQQLVKEYYIHGPVKAARLMSQRLGRKVNESSVRSVVRNWKKFQEQLETDST